MECPAKKGNYFAQNRAIAIPVRGTTDATWHAYRNTPDVFQRIEAAILQAVQVVFRFGVCMT